MASALSSDIIKTNLSDGIAWITLDRPAVLNALDRQMRVSLATVFRKLAAADAVSTIVLKGAGRAFCAGQDQRESAGMNAADAARRIEDYADLYRAIRSTLKPVIAQVHGFAIGAGLQLALLADIAFVAKSTKVGMPELERGSASITGSGLMWPIIGESAMKWLVLRGHKISAEEAARIHLVQEVVEDERLEDTVVAFARTLAALPQTGTRVTKEWWNRMGEDLFEQTLARAREAHAQNFGSGNFTDAARQFLERKKQA